MFGEYGDTILLCPFLSPFVSLLVSGRRYRIFEQKTKRQYIILPSQKKRVEAYAQASKYLIPISISIQQSKPDLTNQTPPLLLLLLLLSNIPLDLSSPFPFPSLFQVCRYSTYTPKPYQVLLTYPGSRESTSRFFLDRSRYICTVLVLLPKRVRSANGREREREAGSRDEMELG